MTQPEPPYYQEFPGTWSMTWHDRQESALKRWFDNYKMNKYASFASDVEWLTITEQRRRRGFCYIGEIGADDGRAKRTVEFDYSAPAPPTFMRPALRKPEPPRPKKVSGDAMWHSELRYLEEMYRLDRRLLSPYHYTSAQFLGLTRTPIIELERPATPPEPKYRRN